MWAVFDKSYNQYNHLNESPPFILAKTGYFFLTVRITSHFGRDKTDICGFLKTFLTIYESRFFPFFCFQKLVFTLRTQCGCQHATRRLLKDPPGIENMKEQRCLKILWHRNQDRL